ncbi:hypothetical protein BDA99DRAFT_531453 [Phascolomyces articulosus]|uniref:Uncharacterized protein n=1 Tax=Phascolomyces articulosus TaxID=60185 RepID=A0AAD5KRZ5_9FUNG|nr:hypothetical protein BDA99DRAFT_531453 [Phascolomyces articulosus]
MNAIYFEHEHPLSLVKFFLSKLHWMHWLYYLKIALDALDALDALAALDPSHRDSDESRKVFGDTLLAKIVSTFKELWSQGCTEFTEDEVPKFGVAVSAYQNSVDDVNKKGNALKKIVAELAVMVLDMDPIKTSVVNAIRRL